MNTMGSLGSMFGVGVFSHDRIFPLFDASLIRTSSGFSGEQIIAVGH